MAPKLYSMFASPPCRAVLLTAKVMNLDLQVTNVDLQGGGTKSPEFCKINPQHSIPFLDDDGTGVAESRAILMYLVEKYGKNDSLYPKDLKLRATVNARLFFDASTFYPRVGAAYLAPLFRGTTFSESNIPPIDDALAILDAYIGQNLYLVNNQLTIADISAVVTLSCATGVGHDISKFKNVSRWFENLMKVLPNYEELNQKAVNLVADIYNEKFGKK